MIGDPTLSQSGVPATARLGSNTSSAHAAQSRPTRMAMLQCVTEPPDVNGCCSAAGEPVCTSRAEQIVGFCPLRAVISSLVSRRVRDGFAATRSCHGYSSVVPALFLWACTSSPDGHPDAGRGDGPSFTLSISQGELAPAFDPDILHYTVAGSALTEPTTTIATSDGDAILEQRTMDGDVLAGDAGSIEVPLAEREYVRVSTADRVYQITVVPSDLGIVSAEGVASEGFLLLTPAPFRPELDDLASYLVIVDERGVPVWYRRALKPSYDFHAIGDGRLSYIGDAGMGGQSDIVLGPDYAIERVVDAQTGAGGESVETDNHFFDFLGDDAIVAGTASRFVDLTSYGAPDGCCVLRDFVLQRIAPDDTVVFEWSSKDHLDFSTVPVSLLAEAVNGFGPAHINSWAV